MVMVGENDYKNLLVIHQHQNFIYDLINGLEVLKHINDIEKIIEPEES